MVALGGGRQVESDVIDPAVGLSRMVRLGDKVEKGLPLVTIHAAREDAAQRAEAAVRRAITLAETPPDLPDLIRDRIG